MTVILITLSNNSWLVVRITPSCLVWVLSVLLASFVVRGCCWKPFLWGPFGYGRICRIERSICAEVDLLVLDDV